MVNKESYRYNIIWGCCDGRNGLFVGDTKQEICLLVDLDDKLKEQEKHDIKYGFFSEYKEQDYFDRDMTWDNGFSISWRKNFF